jgi:hypothetical protein
MKVWIVKVQIIFRGHIKQKKKYEYNKLFIYNFHYNYTSYFVGSILRLNLQPASYLKYIYVHFRMRARLNLLLFNKKIIGDWTGCNSLYISAF